MGHESLGFHETMDTHEMLNFKTACLMKSKMIQGICFDNDLKALLEKDIKQSVKDLEELQTLYKKAQTN
ncbi:spore coat protein [Anaerobacillus sp. MEB173]|uniref:spore coat protein n=1 Tax=Anaerobacillus sp. MEB173 TaxID=3383345 RepID=UPI003F8FBA2A